MFSSTYLWPLLLLPLAASQSATDLSWNPPISSWITNLSDIINGTGTHGFIFNSSELPKGTEYARTYNWCNMPHVRLEDYPIAPLEYELDYVEVIHRHHKRTPYESNLFPEEVPPWSCTDTAFSYASKPTGPQAHHPADTSLKTAYHHSSNPFITPETTNWTCQFPQITHGGLEDSYQHGRDLYSVYHDKHSFLPDLNDQHVQFRVTNNRITSQVAGMVIAGMYGSDSMKDLSDSPIVPLHVQPYQIDSLEPAYSCPAAVGLYSAYAVGSNNTAWLSHLSAAKPFFTTLDAASKIEANNTDWHVSFDHYFDNLSARQCHGLPLPPGISQKTANAVYRLGQHEYSLIYRALEPSLRFSTGSYGVWLAELADNIEKRWHGKSKVRFRHNVGHDGSISRLLSFLQVETMVWPGMGAELVFEVYKLGSKESEDVRNGGDGKRWVRVLWGGQVLVSSNPVLGKMHLMEAEVFLDYIYAITGKKAEKVKDFCNST
ncbi:phosphoglycerate mutase-like protein [Mytilinidion resinicola]|uniref:Phosphoglycerate mutase-like protein n=1 Tax=Mytilinidion resinicola TaxID=574789 RepID=A0A6A6Z9B1_9PEZI|nr:phosphoglycerate mutase-like protein [Mytilinidion resinicola]KAF2816874.1 phosphoglycerate mutase-like protein [Mytilinidion resinicola]